MPVVPAILTRNKRHFGLAVGDRIFWGMQDFDFAQIYSNQICPNITQICSNFAQICPNLINFASKKLLGNAAAYVA